MVAEQMIDGERRTVDGATSAV